MASTTRKSAKRSLEKSVPSLVATRRKHPRCLRREAIFCVGQHVKVLRTHLEGDIRPPVYYHAIVRTVVSRRVGLSSVKSVPFRYDVSTPYFDQQTATSSAPLLQLRYRETSVPEHRLFKLDEVVPSNAVEVPFTGLAVALPLPIVSIKKNCAYLVKQENDRSFIRTGTVPCPEHAHYDGKEKFRLDLRTELSQCLKADIAQCEQDTAEDGALAAESSSSPNYSETARRLTLVEGLPDTFMLDFTKAEFFLSTLREATLLERDVVAIIKDGVTSARDPERDYAKTPARVSMSYCSEMHDIGTVQTNVRHWTDGEKECLTSTNVETTLGFKYTYSPIHESHAVSRCMPWRVRICLEELTRILRSNGMLHHDVNACQLLTYDVRRGVSIGFHHDGSPSSSQAENSQLLGTSVLSISLGAPMDLVFAIQHKESINGMDEVVSLRMSHGMVLSMGPITDIMYKHSARPCADDDGRDHKGIRHVFVCRALTIVKRFYGAGCGHPDFPFQLIPTQQDQERLAERIRERLSQHRYPVQLEYPGRRYKGYVTGVLDNGKLEVWVPEDNSCVEVGSARIKFLKNRFPGF